MAESSWPTVAGGRSITDVQWEEMAAGFAASGIIAGTSDTSTVYADSSGMQVKVRASKFAIVAGNGWTSGSSEFTKAIGANASGSTRIDLVVLRLTRSTRVVTTEVRAGTPGAGVPSPVQDAAPAGTGVWELPVAQVTVVSGASTISASDVVNIAPYVGSPQILYVTTASALDRILNPTSGQIGFVAAEAATGFPLYQYITGTGWRRVDWNRPWGVIGGKVYTGSGDLFFFPPSMADVGLRTGSVTLLSGRRYVVELSLPVAYSTSGSDVVAYLVFRVSKAGGANIGDAACPPANTYQAWLWQRSVDYVPSSDETVDFALAALVAKVGGAATLYSASGQRHDHNTYFRVRDIGPASKLTAA